MDGNAPIESIYFDGQGAWVGLTPSEIRGDGPVPKDMLDYIDGLRANGPFPISVFFDGQRWLVVGANGVVRTKNLEIPREVAEHLQGAKDAGAVIRSIAFNARGWVVVTDRGVRAGGKIPPDLDDLIRKLLNDNVPIQSVSLSPNDAWIVVFK